MTGAETVEDSSQELVRMRKIALDLLKVLEPHRNRGTDFNRAYDLALCLAGNPPPTLLLTPHL